MSNIFICETSDMLYQITAAHFTTALLMAQEKAHAIRDSFIHTPKQRFRAFLNHVQMVVGTATQQEGSWAIVGNTNSNQNQLEQTVSNASFTGNNVPVSNASIVSQSPARSEQTGGIMANSFSPRKSRSVPPGSSSPVATAGQQQSQPQQMNASTLPVLPHHIIATYFTEDNILQWFLYLTESSIQCLEETMITWPRISTMVHRATAQLNSMLTPSPFNAQRWEGEPYFHPDKLVFKGELIGGCHIAIAMFVDTWQKVFLVLDDSNEVMITGVHGGNTVLRWVGHTARILAVHFVTSIQRFVTSACDRTAVVWDHKHNTVAARLYTNQSPIVAMTSVGSTGTTATIFGARLDCTVGVYKSTGGQPVSNIVGQQSLGIHRDWITDILYVEEFDFLVTSSLDKTAQSFSSRETTCIPRARFVGHEKGIRHSVFNEPSRYFATAAAKEVGVWDSLSQGLTEPLHMFTTHERPVVFLYSDLFAPCIFSIDSGSTVVVYSLTQMAVHSVLNPGKTHPIELRTAIFNPSKRHIHAFKNTGGVLVSKPAPVQAPPLSLPPKVISLHVMKLRDIEAENEPGAVGACYAFFVICGSRSTIDVYNARRNMVRHMSFVLPIVTGEYSALACIQNRVYAATSSGKIQVFTVKVSDAAAKRTENSHGKVLTFTLDGVASGDNPAVITHMHLTSNNSLFLGTSHGFLYLVHLVKYAMDSAATTRVSVGDPGGITSMDGLTGMQIIACTTKNGKACVWNTQQDTSVHVLLQADAVGVVFVLERSLVCVVSRCNELLFYNIGSYSMVIRKQNIVPADKLEFDVNIPQNASTIWASGILDGTHGTSKLGKDGVLCVTVTSTISKSAIYYVPFVDEVFAFFTKHSKAEWLGNRIARAEDLENGVWIVGSKIKGSCSASLVEAISSLNDTLVMLKTYPEKKLAVMQQEVNVLKRCGDNPFVVSFVDNYRTTIVLERGQCNALGYAPFRGPNGDFSGDESKRGFLISLLLAVRGLHHQGFVHTSISPKCLVLCCEGKIWKLCGLDTAVKIGSEAKEDRIQYKQHPQYSAPELCRAKLRVAGYATTVIPAATIDIWAIGVIALEVFLNQRLFPPIGNNYDLSKTISKFHDATTHSMLVKLRDVDIGLATMVEGCLKSNPAERWSSVDDMIYHLNNYGWDIPLSSDSDSFAVRMGAQGCFGALLKKLTRLQTEVSAEREERERVLTPRGAAVTEVTGETSELDSGTFAEDKKINRSLFVFPEDIPADVEPIISTASSRSGGNGDDGGADDNRTAVAQIECVNYDGVLSIQRAAFVQMGESSDDVNNNLIVLEDLSRHDNAATLGLYSQHGETFHGKVPHIAMLDGIHSAWKWPEPKQRASTKLEKLRMEAKADFENPNRPGRAERAHEVEEKMTELLKKQTDTERYHRRIEEEKLRSHTAQRKKSQQVTNISSIGTDPVDVSVEDAAAEQLLQERIDSQSSFFVGARKLRGGDNLALLEADSYAPKPIYRIPLQRQRQIQIMRREKLLRHREGRLRSQMEDVVLDDDERELRKAHRIGGGVGIPLRQKPTLPLSFLQRIPLTAKEEESQRTRALQHVEQRRLDIPSVIPVTRQTASTE